MVDFGAWLEDSLKVARGRKRAGVSKKEGCGWVWKQKIEEAGRKRLRVWLVDGFVKVEVEIIHFLVSVTLGFSVVENEDASSATEIFREWKW